MARCGDRPRETRHCHGCNKNMRGCAPEVFTDRGSSQVVRKGLAVVSLFTIPSVLFACWDATAESRRDVRDAGTRWYLPDLNVTRTCRRASERSIYLHFLVANLVDLTMFSGAEPHAVDAHSIHRASTESHHHPSLSIDVTRHARRTH